jgi:hypothetical protein
VGRGSLPKVRSAHDRRKKKKERLKRHKEAAAAARPAPAKR